MKIIISILQLIFYKDQEFTIQITIQKNYPLLTDGQNDNIFTGYDKERICPACLVQFPSRYLQASISNPTHGMFAQPCNHVTFCSKPLSGKAVRFKFKLVQSIYQLEQHINVSSLTHYDDATLPVSNVAVKLTVSPILTVHGMFWPMQRKSTLLPIASWRA